MSLHTPGPWTAGSHYQVLDQSVRCIAEVYGDKHIEADHRLIAAAPDLAEALAALLYACDSPELIGKARAALATAGFVGAQRLKAIHDEIATLKGATLSPGVR
jgi:hypothetical protein